MRTVIFACLILCGCRTATPPPAIKPAVKQTPPVEYISIDVPEYSWEVVWSAALAKKMGGIAEARQRDGSRVDVLTDEYAIEVDWVKKADQALGQSLHYGYLTRKKPAVALCVRGNYDRKKLFIATQVAKENGIRVFVISSTKKQ